MVAAVPQATPKRTISLQDLPWDNIQVIPATMLGSAVAGAISMSAGAQFLVPHGGIFAALIPGAVTHLVSYLGAIVVGTIVTTGALFFLKRPLTEVIQPALAAAP